MIDLQKSSITEQEESDEEEHEGEKIRHTATWVAFNTALKYFE